MAKRTRNSRSDGLFELGSEISLAIGTKLPLIRTAMNRFIALLVQRPKNTQDIFK
jgi:hypothetical protein